MIASSDAAATRSKVRRAMRRWSLEVDGDGNDGDSDGSATIGEEKGGGAAESTTDNAEYMVGEDRGTFNGSLTLLEGPRSTRIQVSASSCNTAHPHSGSSPFMTLMYFWRMNLGALE